MKDLIFSVGGWMELRSNVCSVCNPVASRNVVELMKFQLEIPTSAIKLTKSLLSLTLNMILNNKNDKNY